MRILPVYTRFEFWSVITMGVAFFMPWIAFGPISFAGYQVGDYFRQSSGEGSGREALASILIYLIVAVAIVTAVVDATTTSKAARSFSHACAGLAPMALAAIAIHEIGDHWPRVLSIGAFLTLAAAVISLVGAGVLLTRPEPGSKSVWSAPRVLTIFAAIMAILSGFWLLHIVTLVVIDIYSSPSVRFQGVLLVLAYAILGAVGVSGGVALAARQRSGLVLSFLYAALVIVDTTYSLLEKGPRDFMRIPFVGYVFVSSLQYVLLCYCFVGPLLIALLALFGRYGMPQIIKEPSVESESPRADERLQELHALLARGLITPEDYERAKGEVLAGILSSSSSPQQG